MKFIELSHTITDQHVECPGTPPVVIKPWMDFDATAKEFGEKCSCMLDKIELVNTSGTYLDSPYHRSRDGYTVADIPLEKVVDLPYEVLTLTEGKNYYDVKDVEHVGQKGGAVLLCTFRSEVFGTEAYAKDNPYLTVAAAENLMEKGVVFVGIDCILVDNVMTQPEIGNPVHDVILQNCGVICEGMVNLRSILDGQGTLTAVPPKIAMASFPARVFVKLQD